ncbi:TonB-dependent siderophore receptor [Pseudomonas eucalypticola]|uniref:TonB-dependent siderophore receptor n=1 Tax=Pseudomonas eucalypticola TaxID=2599595 RepID=A0A7D5D6K1_9PSED|nr:TonB-dependent siderophore receptor [Pseudomonas eucalypticola]QKZ04053.1 TonB-dependent siderophore receptor [Pseudomonas eucalypticola]
MPISYPRPQQRSTLRPLLLSSLLASAWLPCPPLQAATTQQETNRDYSIAAGDLDPALNQFAQASGILLSIDGSLTAGKRTGGLQGRHGVVDALARLLAGSGLRSVQHGDTWSVEAVPQRDGSLELAPSSVVASALGATTEGTGSYTTGSTATATKMAMSLRETPQSVTVITRQRMDDENVQSLDDVARTTPGITYTKIGTERSTYYARGFEINDLQFDGIPTNVSENYSMDVMSTANMAIYDRVEIVRGANGLMQGTGNPSAAINLVRKRPTRDFRLSAELGTGSWDNYRSQVDVSGPLTDDGRVRGRAVAYYNTANSFRDGAGKDNQLLYLVGEADLDDATTLTVGATLQQDRNNGYDWGGLNTRVDGSFYPLSRSASLAGKWAYLDKTNYTVFSDLTHQFDNDWKLTLAVNAISSDAQFLSSYPARVTSNTSGNQYTLPISKVGYDDRQYGFDLYATGPFSALGREHQLVFGANLRRDDFDAAIYKATNTPSIDITSFDWDSIATPIVNPASRADYNYVRKEKGVYGATRLSLTDSLSLILGSRVSWSDYAIDSPSTVDSYKENRHVVPYAGLVFDLDTHHTLYASYTEIYKTQSYFGVGNKLLAPIEGENYEAGIKGEYFGGRLNTSLALFQTNLTHMPEAIAGASTCGVTGTSSCYEEGGKVRNNGFEIEINGQPAEGWNLGAGFTYSDPEYVAGKNKGTDYYTRIPRRLLKLSTDYRLPGSLNQWRAGGEVFAQSRTYSQASTYDIEQGGYALVNLHLNYQIDEHFNVQYNLNNALDRTYYQTLPTSNNFGGLFYGEPRNFAVTLRYQY